MKLIDKVRLLEAVVREKGIAYAECDDEAFEIESMVTPSDRYDEEEITIKIKAKRWI